MAHPLDPDLLLGNDLAALRLRREQRTAHQCRILPRLFLDPRGTHRRRGSNGRHGDGYPTHECDRNPHSDHRRRCAECKCGTTDTRPTTRVEGDPSIHAQYDHRRIVDRDGRATSRIGHGVCPGSLSIRRASCAVSLHHQHDDVSRCPNPGAKFPAREECSIRMAP